MRKILFQALVNGKLTEPYEVGSELSELHGQGCRMNIGKKDETGKEIYSGDKMQWIDTMQSKEDYAKNPYKRVTVIWNNREAKFENCFQGEIFGNIYES